MHTHGWWWNSSTGVGPFPGFRTGTVALNYGVYPENGLIEDKYLSDLLFWRLAVSKKPNHKGVFHYVVLPRFVEKYVESNMENTFLYLGYCHSLQNDKMWNAFKAKGAKVALGWDDEIERKTNANFFKALMEKMLPGSIVVDPLTLAGALEQVDEDLTWDGNGALEVLTASSEWKNFIFKEKEYLVVSAGSLSFVWDPKTNDYAELKNDGETVSYPINEEILTAILTRKNSYNSLRGYSYLSWDHTETCNDGYFTGGFYGDPYDLLGGSGTYDDPWLFNRRGIWSKNGEPVIEWSGCSSDWREFTFFAYTAACAATSLYTEDQGKTYKTSMSLTRRYAYRDGSVVFDESSYFTPLEDEQPVVSGQWASCNGNAFYGPFGTSRAIRNKQDNLFTQVYHAKLLTNDEDAEFPVIDIIHSSLAVDYEDSLGNPFEQARNEALETAMLDLMHAYYDGIGPESTWTDGPKIYLKIDYASR